MYARLLHIDEVWLALEPLDLRAGTESALAKVVAVFGTARPHHGPCAYSAVAPYVIFRSPVLETVAIAFVDGSQCQMPWNDFPLRSERL
jgi:hypothetical protein